MLIEKKQEILSGSMEKWIIAAKKIFPNEYEEFKKSSGRKPSEVKFTNIVYIISDRKYEHISSSGVKMVKSIESHSKSKRDLTSKYLP